MIGNAVPPLTAFALAKSILKDNGQEAPTEPIVRKNPVELPPRLAKNVTTTIGKRRRMPLARRFQNHVPGSITDHSKNACRVDLDNKGTHPRIHSMMRFKSAEGVEPIRHITEWKTTLYTGYAKNVKRSRIRLGDAIGLLVQAEREGLVNRSYVAFFIEELVRELPNETPDASTLQAVRARRHKKVEMTPYDVLERISRKVDRYFPIESFDWSKRIKDSHSIAS